MRLLWDVVSNDQLRTAPRHARAAAVERHVVCPEVVVIIQCKAQAELSRASAIDEYVTGVVKDSTVPIADRRSAEYGSRISIRR